MTRGVGRKDLLSVSTKKKRYHKKRSLRRRKRYVFVKPYNEEMRNYYSEAQRMKRRYKKDNNHNVIADQFRINGYSVFDTSQMGNGFPDMVVSKDGKNVLVEVKSSTGVLTPAQVIFKKEWQGDYHIIRSTEEAAALIESMAVNDNINEATV